MSKPPDCRTRPLSARQENKISPEKNSVESLLLRKALPFVWLGWDFFEKYLHLELPSFKLLSLTLLDPSLKTLR